MEATWLALGIYEDTGGFLYDNTTPLDFEAVAYLRSKKFDVHFISVCSLLDPPWIFNISSNLLFLINRLIGLYDEAAAVHGRVES